MAQIKFYDLEINPKGLIWSPNTCKTRFALNVKNIPYDTEWVGFHNLHGVVSSKTKSGVPPTVPIIEDFTHDGKVIQDSWEIAKYLEETYPDTPSLFHGSIGVHKAFEEYSAAKITSILFKMCVLQIHENCGSEEIKQWFRENREAKLGTTLENFAGDAKTLYEPLKDNLRPVHTVLTQYPFVTGDKVGWADVALASHFTLLSSLRPDIFEEAVLNAYDDAAIRDWWNRMEKYRGEAPQ
ncbi:hypothetical protein K501DRAFT_336708 [Backusella circina FSU 941]|nr:hypothetical protein K501DRAFT_336708 [Backusella circina FSU 941]